MYQVIKLGLFSDVLTVSNIESFVNVFDELTIPNLVSAFNNMFDLLGISAELNILIYILSWFIQVWLLHIVVDFILILPKICQKFIDKVCD